MFEEEKLSLYLAVFCSDIHTMGGIKHAIVITSSKVLLALYRQQQHENRACSSTGDE